MCGIALPGSSEYRFHLDLVDSLTTDFTVITCSVATWWRFKIIWSEICSVFLLLLPALALVQRALILDNLFTAAIDDICLSLWVTVEKFRSAHRTPRRAGGFSKASSCWSPI